LRSRHSPAGAQPVRADTGFIRVQLERVSLALNGRPILRSLDWEIHPGQRWVLLGANGAGKTLLLKLLAGDVWPTPGRSRRHYYCGGERFDDPYGVKQHIAYIGAERQDRYERYGWNAPVEAVIGTGLYRTDLPLDALTPQDRTRVTALLRLLDLEPLARRRFLTLSYGERRLVLLARALASAPRLLLLDELLSGLDPLNRTRALHCLTAISRSPLPWVLTTHRADELPSSATHCCQLQAGRIRLLRTPPPVVVSQTTGPARAVAASLTRRRVPASTPASSEARALVTLNNVTLWREGARALRGLSLAIAAGECWVIHGANGSGKSSLIQLLYGDLSAASGGTLSRAGLSRGSPIEQFKRRVGLVSPELQTLHPRHVRVDEVVASGRRASIGHDGPIAARSRVQLRRALRRVHIAALEARTFGALSYGQARLVLFARALVHGPDILLLDEPYAGLDASTRERLQILIGQTVQSGVTVVMATHHREDWPGGATHELELVRGRARYCGPVRASTRPPRHDSRRHTDRAMSASVERPW
jgi:molybdate transport system ATP-binding protein